MNRYALFAGLNHYPGGRWDDLVAFYPDAVSAEAEGVRRAVAERFSELSADWWHVVDVETGTKVSQGERRWD